MDASLSSLDRDFNLYTRLDGDGSDLLDNLRRRVQVDQALVDAHLVAIPGLGTLTVRSLAGGDAQGLGRQTDRSLDLELLVLGAVDQVTADLLQVLDVAGGQSDADLVHLGFDLLFISGLVLGDWGGGLHFR